MKKNYQKRYEKALARAEKLYRTAYALAEKNDNEQMEEFRLGRLALIYEVLKNGFGLSNAEIEEQEKLAVAEPSAMVGAAG